MASVRAAAMEQGEFAVAGRAASSFAQKCFVQLGLQELAEQVVSGEVLSRDQAVHLARVATLPVLGKMIELREHHVLSQGAGPREVKIRPVFFLPLAELIETLGVGDAVAAGSERLEQLQADITVSQQLSLAIDRWQGQFELDVLLGALTELTDRHKLYPVNVSTAELEDLGRVLGAESLKGVEQVLEHLWRRGYKVIEGGADIATQSLAAKKGFLLRTGQRVASSDAELFRFVEELYALREALVASGRWEVWFPWTSAVLDRQLSAGSPLGVQLLKTIALGRLLLPEVRYIRAPLSLLGIKVAQVATHFGANDLGFATVDENSAEVLGIMRLSEVEEIMGVEQMTVRVMR